MGVLTQEDLLKNLDFKCTRCQADCTKVDATEPELGYIAHDGEFFGPLCTSCFEEIPKEQQAIRNLPETAFFVVVKQNGEGTYVTTEGIPFLYLREPTFNDIIKECGTVSRDMHDAISTQKLLSQLITVLSAPSKNNRIILPK